MTKRLTKLEIHEISLVDKGANPGAHISFFKREGNDMNLEELQKQLADVTAERDILKAVSDFTDVEKAYYDDLDDAEKGKFREMDKEKREKEMKEKMGDKYKKALSEDDVAEITKRADDAEAEIAKRDEEIKKRDEKIAKLEGDVSDAEIRAEVEKKFPNSAGTVEEKVAKLKAIRSIEDEGVRKSLENDLELAEKQAEGFSSETGASGDAEPKDAEEKLDGLAKKYAKDNNVSVEKAYSKVLETEEGKKLYNNR